MLNGVPIYFEVHGTGEPLLLLHGFSGWRRHPRGDAQIEALLASTRAFADSYGDMNFTPAYLGTITARTLIVQGDRDPLYPVEISVQMAKAIPRSDLWILPGAGHGPVLGERWTEFLKTAAAFLRG